MGRTVTEGIHRRGGGWQNADGRSRTGSVGCCVHGEVVARGNRWGTGRLLVEARGSVLKGRLPPPPSRVGSNHPEAWDRDTEVGAAPGRPPEHGLPGRGGVAQLVGATAPTRGVGPVPIGPPPEGGRPSTPLRSPALWSGYSTPAGTGALPPRLRSAELRRIRPK